MSLVEAAEAVRQKGRYGDSVLMHVNPQEMQTLATGSGGYLTVNPDTGLPEAFLSCSSSCVRRIRRNRPSNIWHDGRGWWSRCFHGS